MERVQETSSGTWDIRVISRSLEERIQRTGSTRSTARRLRAANTTGQFGHGRF